MRRYDMTHDPHSGNWKMARSDQGQYVPWVDVERLQADHEHTTARYVANSEAMLCERARAERAEAHLAAAVKALRHVRNCYLITTACDIAQEALASIEAVTK